MARFKLALAGALLFVLGSEAFAQAPFYQGKTIRIVVGFTPGGFYDRWARLLARYMPKYIPGSPEIVVQNMPGAGSLIASNHVFGAVKPDGLTLLMPSSNIYLDQLVGRAEVKFDLRRFPAVGTQEKNHIILYMRADAPYRSIADIRSAKEPPKCGATGTAGADYVIARTLEEVVPGLKINTVLGYPGGSEIDVAVERGEVQCRGMTIPPHFGREPFDSWHKRGFDRHLVQTGRSRDPRAPEAPTIYEIMDEFKTAEVSRRAAQVLLAGGEFGRPMFVTPGTPPERVRVLREAYAKALRDPELLAEAKKGRMDVDPSTGEELDALVKEVMNQPPEVIERVKRILGQ
jgi:tripartite-type tricarboxylate transporter receptor subunit TctC